MPPGALDAVDGLLRSLPAWQKHAACADPPPGVDWFPERGPGLPDPKAVVARAREVCASCPVSSECLEYALSDPTLQGVWAGTTEVERRQIRRERRQKAA